MTAYEPVIGIEVHVELATQTKMFCACENRPFELEPNSATCPTCLGLPGALPVANSEAIQLGIRAALALNCQVGEVCMFERKNYAYPDLIKGYQISQYALPIGRNGFVTIHDDSIEKNIQIRRAHLEEDTAKLTHRQLSSGKSISLLDCNRSGVPLLEIVTEPTIHSAQDAELFLRELRSILIHNGISRCRMQRGEMRLEANISLRPEGSEEFGPRVEIKNQSSFRFVREALAYEIARQSDLLDQGQPVKQATVGWDSEARRTFEQRLKEEAHDYRYFPEPDLPPIEIGKDWIERQRRAMPESLDSFRRRLLQSGISAADIHTVVMNDTVEFLHQACSLYPDGAGSILRCLIRDVFSLVNEKKIPIGDSNLTPVNLVEVVKLVDGGEINFAAQSKILQELFAEGGSAEAIMKRDGLGQVSDAGAIAFEVDQVLQERSDLVEQYRAGKAAVRNALFGQIMKRLKGRGDPKQIDSLLQKRLDG